MRRLLSVVSRTPIKPLVGVARARPFPTRNAVELATRKVRVASNTSSRRPRRRRGARARVATSPSRDSGALRVHGRFPSQGTRARDARRRSTVDAAEDSSAVASARSPRRRVRLRSARAVATRARRRPRVVAARVRAARSFRALIRSRGGREIPSGSPPRPPARRTANAR
eukprot:31383-Pelagococcus_subviridis.AAC.10